jgi:ArsR family transcriptional regulator
VLQQSPSSSAESGPESIANVVLDSSIQSMVQLFKLVSDGTRLRILFLLRKEKEINVRTLCGLLQQSQPAVSHHLGLLRVAGLIACRRDGKHNYYYLVTEKLTELIDLLCREAIGKTDAFLLPNYQVSSRDD